MSLCYVLISSIHSPSLNSRFLAANPLESLLSTVLSVDSFALHFSQETIRRYRFRPKTSPGSVLCFCDLHNFRPSVCHIRQEARLFGQLPPRSSHAQRRGRFVFCVIAKLWSIFEIPAKLWRFSYCTIAKLWSISITASSVDLLVSFAMTVSQWIEKVCCCVYEILSSKSGQLEMWTVGNLNTASAL
jgi:hypothetical protein